MTSDADAGIGAVADASEMNRVGALLDADHAPETNGRMAVCRKCGMGTEGPDGKHAPLERQLAQAAKWLDAQLLSSRIARLKSRQDT